MTLDDSDNDQGAKVISLADRKVTRPSVAVSPPAVSKNPAFVKNTKALVFGHMVHNAKVLVSFMAQYPGLGVPGHITKDRVTQNLHFSHKFGPALLVDEAGVYQELSFSGVDTVCFVPWGAVFRIVNTATGEEVVWPKDAVQAMVQPEPKPAVMSCVVCRSTSGTCGHLSAPETPAPVVFSVRSLEPTVFMTVDPGEEEQT